MGRPSSTHSFTDFNGSTHAALLDTAGAATETRNWCEKDADPEEEAWWTGKDVVFEAFLDQPAKRGDAHGVDAGAGATRTTSHPTLMASPGVEDATAVGLTLKPAADAPTMQADNQRLFPGRYTISDAELANIVLDSAIVEDDTDDFELEWDGEDESLAMDEVEYDEPETLHSDVSTPTPSTPIVSPQHPMLEVDASFPQELSRSHTLPASSMTIGTPLRQASLQFPAPSKSIQFPASPMPTARSAALPRGFAMHHGPRTELVL